MSENHLMPTDLQLGDIVRLRKPHPCGGTDWEIVRLGADIGLKCLTCQHRVLLTRRELEKRLKTFVQRAQSSDEALSAEKDDRA